MEMSVDCPSPQATSGQVRPLTLDRMQEINDQFRQQGWLLLQLPSPGIVYQVRERLEAELRLISRNNTITLESYHEVVSDDERHHSRQIAMTDFFRKERLGLQIVEQQVDFFRLFLGPDLLVQESPYLRITRPKKAQDNVGYHRDTTYGGSPFELSFWVPFVETTVKNTISVLPGSNLKSESAYPVKQENHPSITKGSPLHLAGFPYAPLVLQADVEDKMLPVPVRLGEALIFSLSTLHGSVVNQDFNTRWSMDTRVLNKLAPVDLSERPYRYHTLSRSAVTEQAEIYLKNQNASA